MAQGCRKATGRRNKYPRLQAIDARHRGMGPGVEADAALAAAAQQHFFARDVHGVGHFTLSRRWRLAAAAAHRLFGGSSSDFSRVSPQQSCARCTNASQKRSVCVLTTLHTRKKHGALPFMSPDEGGGTGFESVASGGAAAGILRLGAPLGAQKRPSTFRGDWHIPPPL